MHRLSINHRYRDARTHTAGLLQRGRKVYPKAIVDLRGVSDQSIHNLTDTWRDGLQRSSEVAEDRSADASGRSMKESLRAARIAKATLLALTATDWLMAVLGSVAHACGRFEENVLNLSALRNISLSRRITA